MSALAGNIAIFVPHTGCPQQCSFCDQRVISGQVAAPTATELQATCRRALSSLSAKAGRVEIAFFGGSFTAIARDYMVELLAAAQPFLSDPRVAGIRLSTRPDAIDAERLELLQRYGVTAIELGAQSMDDSVLQGNRRGHTAADIVAASQLVRSYGFSLGLQMMTGLYGSSPEQDYSTAVALADLAPDTVRIYPTVVLQGTHLARLMAAGSYSPPDVAASVPLCATLCELFERRGVRVIRIGLQASAELAAQVVGGCYHPALGELVLGERYYHRLLAACQQLGGNSFTLRVCRRLQSQVLGQRKCNVARLNQNGYNIDCRIDDTVDGVFAVERRGELS